MRAAWPAPAIYFGPPGARRMLVRADPRIPDEILGVEIMLPSQWAPRRSPAPPGARALVGALLESACCDAGLLPAPEAGARAAPRARPAMAPRRARGRGRGAGRGGVRRLGVDPAALAGRVRRLEDPPPGP